MKAKPCSKAKAKPKPIRPADNFRDAYRALGRDLFNSDLYAAYYAERPESPVGQLKERLLTEEGPCHILYVGQRKSGKTTELLRLKEELKDDYFVVFLSVLEDMEPSDVKPVDLLLFAATRLYREAAEAGVKMGRDIEKDLAEWLLQISGDVFQTIVKEKTRGGGAGLKLKAVVAELDGGFKVNYGLRKEIRTHLAPRVAELVNQTEVICRKLKQKLGKEALVIIDDMEKAMDLEEQENMFFKHAATMSKPPCRMVYTVDRALCYLPTWKQIKASFPNSVELQSIRTMTRDDDEYAPGLDLLRGILLRRMSKDLFEPDALERVIRICNGVLSDLLSVCRNCCLDAMTTEDANRITWQMVDRNHQRLTNDFMRMIAGKYYPKLKRIHATRKAKPSTELSELLAMQAVIEYEDKAGLYYDVHPAVVPLLK